MRGTADENTCEYEEFHSRQRDTRGVPKIPPKWSLRDGLCLSIADITEMRTPKPHRQAFVGPDRLRTWGDRPFTPQPVFVNRDDLGNAEKPSYELGPRPWIRPGRTGRITEHKTVTTGSTPPLRLSRVVFTASRHPAVHTPIATHCAFSLSPKTHGELGTMQTHRSPSG